MKVVEILKMGAEMMKILSKADIKMGDWRYVGLFMEYEEAMKRGEKVAAVVAELAERWGISEAGVWSVEGA